MREKRITDLLSGKIVQYRESGNSMRGIIAHRQLITCAPIPDYSSILVGDAVYCKVSGRYYTHLVKAVKKRSTENGDRFEFLIGNNHGGINGWTGQERVYGKVVAIGEDSSP